MNGFRVAKATSGLDGLERFYGEGLGFRCIASFENHAGFDGVVFESLEHRLQIEFTVQTGHTDVGIRPSDDLLVMYFDDREAWTSRIDTMRRLGYADGPATNPYWNTHGRTFHDKDGNGVVLYLTSSQRSPSS